MAAPRFLANIAGRIKELVTITTSAGAGDAEKVPSTNADGILDPTLLNATNTSAGAGDADKIPQLDAAGRLDSSMMPVGIGADTATIASSENLAAGDLVNIWNDGGTAKARKADATAEGKEINGFVLAGVTSPANATVYFEGTITGLSGLTAGTRYYMSTTPGALTATAPSSTGNVVQFAGVAVGTTALSFEHAQPVTVA